MRIVLIPGHHIMSPGCTGGNLREQPLVRAVTERVKCICAKENSHLAILDHYPDLVPLTFDPDESYRQQSMRKRIGHINALDPQPDAVVELHLNAVADRQTDYALNIWDGENETAQVLAVDIGHHLTDNIVGSPRTKIWTPTQLGRSKLKLPRLVNAPVVLVEPMFLSCPRRQQEIARDINAWVERYAQGVARGIRAWTGR